MSDKGWIGVDLDGTLAYYDEWVAVDVIGEPIPAMQKVVMDLLAAGKDVKIFTARAARDQKCLVTGIFWTQADIVRLIQDWSEKHLGQRLDVTATKDYKMIMLFDDRSVAVERNTGRLFSWDGLHK